MNKRFINSVVIIDNARVIKNKFYNANEFFEYLESRNFTNFPKVLEITEDKIVYEYVNEEKYYETNKGMEFIRTVSMLHYKTIFFKDVSKNKYRNIYDNISDKLIYLKNYYESMIEDIETYEYMSSSQYLFARNYSCIESSIKYAQSELKKWFKMVEGKSKERVCVIHNNLSTSHFIKGDKNYLISFDHNTVDTPVLDIYNFYKKEGFRLDFVSLLNTYNESLPLTDEEKKLLNILISIPPKLEQVADEYLNTINIGQMFDYIYSSMSVVTQNK